MKKAVKEQEHDGLWGDPVETLTLYNTVQLAWFFVSCAFVVCEQFVRALGRGGQLGIGGTFRVFFCIIDTVASALAHSIAWFVVGFFTGIAVIVRFIFLGVWRSAKLIVFTIPFGIILVVWKGSVWCISVVRNGCDIARDYVAVLPEYTYEQLIARKPPIASPRLWWRKLAVFVGILLLFTLPFPAIRSYQFLSEVRAETESAAYTAFALLKEGKEALQNGEHTLARNRFEEARRTFERAQQAFKQVPSPFRSLAKMMPTHGQRISDGERLLALGEGASRIGVAASEMIEYVSREGAFQEKFYDTLVFLLDAVENAAPLLARIDALAEEIAPDSIPAQHREEFDALTQELSAVRLLADSLYTVRPVLETALGGNEKRRYLLLFQNNTELRPTGGFLGSYALIDVARGKLTNVEIPGGGSYDLQGQLTEYVRAPQPLHLVNPRWEFQDANWFPDFPSSAQKILWFYEKAGGPTVDGVLAINASFFEKLLGIIGPVAMERYGKKLSSENFIVETQKAVEFEYDKKVNKPKQFIADLFPKALEKMSTQSESAGALATLLIEALARRDIQIFLRNAAEQERIAPFGISGAMRQAPRDYQMIVSASVGGGKSDATVHDDVVRRTVIRDDGTLEAHLTVRRVHEGTRGDPFTGTRNSSYVRFYFPRGTTLLSADGFRAPGVEQFESSERELRDDSFLHMIEGAPAVDPRTGMVVTHEFEKTVFGHWLVLDPGQEATVTLVARLPFTVTHLRNRTYTLLFQRQSGSRIRSLSIDYNGTMMHEGPLDADLFLTEHVK